jgi:hypothetical protein
MGQRPILFVSVAKLESGRPSPFKIVPDDFVMVSPLVLAR